MKEKINVEVGLPINLKEQHTTVFEYHASYSVSPLCTNNIRHATVSPSGIVSKYGLLVLDSVSAYPKQQLIYWVTIAYQHITKKVKKTQDNEIYLIIHNPWCPGYFAWLGQAIHRLWGIRDKLSNYVLLLPKKHKKFINTLEPFNFKSIQLFDSNCLVKVNKLVLPKNPPFGGEFIPETLAGIRDLYASYWSKHKVGRVEKEEYIYISRDKAHYRKVVNEDEVMNILSMYGFKKIYLEDYDFWSQVSLLQEAKIVIGIHGAGFTNLHFMRSGGAMLEFVSDRALTKPNFRPSFYRLASLSGIQYLYQACNEKNSKGNPYDTDLVVDITALKEHLALSKSMLSR